MVATSELGPPVSPGVGLPQFPSPSELGESSEWTLTLSPTQAVHNEPNGFNYRSGACQGPDLSWMNQQKSNFSET